MSSSPDQETPVENEDIRNSILGTIREIVANPRLCAVTKGNIGKLGKNDIYVYASTPSLGFTTISGSKAGLLGADIGHTYSFSPRGDTFAIPIRDNNGRPIPPYDFGMLIIHAIEIFARFRTKFFVIPPIGIEDGIYIVDDVFMYFAPAYLLGNVSLPQSIIDKIKEVGS